MISVELRGRLGNQLFQYAICRIMSIKLGVDYSISNDWLGYNFFDLPKTIQKKGNIIFNEGVNMFNENVFKITNNTHLNGYWQSEKYLKDYENDIRKWFNVKDVSLSEDVCVIHFRAQDGYLSSNFVLPIEYFENAKEEIKKYNPKISFLIVTDNILLAKKYFKNDEIIKNDMKKDFILIKSAKYKIISNSTFSWWAAWLGLPNSKTVIAPKRWMNYNYNIFSEDKFYPHNIETTNFKYI